MLANLLPRLGCPGVEVSAYRSAIETFSQEYGPARRAVGVAAPLFAKDRKSHKGYGGGSSPPLKLLNHMAGPTGLEPATSELTARGGVRPHRLYDLLCRRRRAVVMASSGQLCVVA